MFIDILIENPGIDGFCSSDLDYIYPPCPQLIHNLRRPMDALTEQPTELSGVKSDYLFSHCQIFSLDFLPKMFYGLINTSQRHRTPNPDIELKLAAADDF